MSDEEAQFLLEDEEEKVRQHACSSGRLCLFIAYVFAYQRAVYIASSLRTYQWLLGLAAAPDDTEWTHTLEPHH